MDIREIGLQILEELQGVVRSVDPAQLQELENAITRANKVYVAGAGRSLLMIRGLAMRLMQMGHRAYVVGETVTPALAAGDLLIVGSGSGETGALVLMAEKAKVLGARLALITINPHSSIGRLADCVVKIDATTTKGPVQGVSSIQLGANLFEQSLLILCDALVVHMLRGRPIDEANRELMRMHANLE